MTGTVLFSIIILIVIVLLIALAHYDGYAKGYEEGFEHGKYEINEFVLKTNNALGERIEEMNSRK